MPSRLHFCAPILATVLGTAAFAGSVLNSAVTQKPAVICAAAALACGSPTGESSGRESGVNREFLNSALFTSGQASTDKAPTPVREFGLPRYELFLGYSHVRFGVPGSADQTSFGFDGGSVALAYNLNRWLSLAGEFSAYSISKLPSASSASFLVGPRLSRHSDRFTLYAQSLFGGAKLKSDIPTSPSTAFFGNTLQANSFAAALGGGFDVKLSNRIWWRVLQGEYLLTRFSHANLTQQNNTGISTGLVFHIGKLPLPNHAPTINITASPAEIVAGSGETISIRALASDPDNDPLTYTWSATAGEIEGTGAEVRWNPDSSVAGVYTIHSKIDDGHGGTAEASTTVTVRPQPNRPPVVHCEATPQSVIAGQQITITAVAVDPDGDPVTYSFDAQGKIIPVEKSSGIFDTAGLAAGYYTLNCSANDGRGGLATASIDVEIKAPEQKGLEARLSLHSIYFPTGMPTRQAPTGGLLPSQQHTLLTLADDFKAFLTVEPEAHLILQGHADPRGGAAYNQQLSQLRVESAKAFLVGHGISPSLVETDGLGVEQPLSPDQVKHIVQQDPSLTPAEKARLLHHLRVVALAQSRRVDIELSTTGETSVREFPFNAEDALDLLDLRGAAIGRAALQNKRTAARRKTQ